jgi:hypothetical protein
VCFLLGAEALKLLGIVVTVLHLLTMVSIHVAGVVNPVKFKEVSLPNKNPKALKYFFIINNFLLYKNLNERLHQRLFSLLPSIVWMSFCSFHHSFKRPKSLFYIPF